MVGQDPSLPQDENRAHEGADTIMPADSKRLRKQPEGAGVRQPSWIGMMVSVISISRAGISWQ